MKTHVFTHAQGFYDIVLGTGPLNTFLILISLLLFFIVIITIIGNKLNKKFELIETLKKKLMWNVVFRGQI